MKDQQGVKANISGKTGENYVQNGFSAKDFVVIPYSAYQKHPERYAHIDRRLFTNVPYKTVYGAPGRTEFMAEIKSESRQIRIEVKTQNTNGSVDEKLCYTMDNAIKAYPEKETIIVMEGHGFKKDCRSYLKRRARNCKKKKIRIMNFKELTAWLDREFGNTPIAA